MPVTPLHYPVAYVPYALHKKLTLPGLTVGAMFPDLEIPVLYLFCGTDRLMLHSFLGAATLGTLLSVTFTATIYPILVSSLFRVDKHAIHAKTRVSVNLVVSCLLGNLSHVLLDFLNHLDNPLFWPFSPVTLSPICVALGGVDSSFWLVSTPLVSFFAVLLLTHRDNLWEKILVGD